MPSIRFPASGASRNLVILFVVLGSVLLVAPAAFAQQNNLAFRTPPGGAVIAAGQNVKLGTVDVSSFRMIRIVADERVGGAGKVTVRLTLTKGNELVAQLDTFTLSPHEELTRVFEVPGNTITIFAEGQGAVDVLLYGKG